MQLGKRITIFTGAFGSGKTELALNYALQVAKDGFRVALADLDIVSPYFRSRDAAARLAVQGIEVIAPLGELAQADLPVIVPRVHGALADSELHVVLDVGGDDPGATALGQFSDQLQKLPHAVLLVVNTCRPFTRDLSGILSMASTIERAARLKVTGLIANSNLGAETTPDIIRAGIARVAEAARALGVPVVAAGVRNDLVSQVGQLSVPIFPIHIFLLPPWLQTQIIGRDRRAVLATQARLQGLIQ
ncbi:MAG TPA: hypothetical protein GX511_08040 [Firmicutes bacterium]|nr:hypothetical protein [Bacillota bacterium]